MNISQILQDKKWWGHKDLNLGPPGYEPEALTNWAMAPHLVRLYNVQYLLGQQSCKAIGGDRKMYR